MSAPPSITITSPVTHEAASLARKSAARAMSSGSPSRFSGTCDATASSAGSHRARAKSVFTSPGAMALTRTFGASSTARCLVRWMSAALVLSYVPMAPPKLRPPTDAMLRTTPPRAFIAARQASWVHTNGPRRFTSNVLS